MVTVGVLARLEAKPGKEQRRGGSLRGRPTACFTPVRAATHQVFRRRSLLAMRPDQLERRLRERLDALGPAPRAELPYDLMLPDLDRADRIGEFWSYPRSRTFANACRLRHTIPTPAAPDKARLSVSCSQSRSC